ncbi:zinc-binding protein A33-like isoform X2 [Sardina pilchardus]|uniref:zinc-binding protein A33-like isoform X2 n=1 Tax=Sardina pilchardus TaxID=27697 RepID=UPI002E111926
MASRAFSEEDLSCPVCCDIFKDPVLLDCTHSICKSCLQQLQRTNNARKCPICRSKNSRDKYPLNLVLKNLCETFQKEISQRERSCGLHLSEFTHFCKNDNQLACSRCQDTKLHKDHNFSPIDVAGREHKEELKIRLQALQKKLHTLKQAERSYDETAQHLSVQARHTEWQIKDEFEKLHQFLRDEEAARLAALMEEARRKREMMKAYKSTVERAQCTLQDPERVSGALIDVAKHLSNLKFRVWEKMQDIVQCTPVTLDPNTAHPLLTLSEDLASVSVREHRQQLPDNPERFDSCLGVLASEAYNLGIHRWDVEVGTSEIWLLGVKAESGQRKGGGSLSSRVWGVFHVNGEYTAECPSQPETVLTVQKKPLRVRVRLDSDKGQLSFSDLDSNTHLHTFTDTFTERVFPCFITHMSFRILPVMDSSLL